MLSQTDRTTTLADRVQTLSLYIKEKIPGACVVSLVPRLKSKNSTLRFCPMIVGPVDVEFFQKVLLPYLTIFGKECGYSQIRYASKSFTTGYGIVAFAYYKGKVAVSKIRTTRVKDYAKMMKGYDGFLTYDVPDLMGLSALTGANVKVVEGDCEHGEK